MNKFDALLEVASKLNGPGGCPWDLKQTFFSLQPYVIEEAYEVIEAIDNNNDAKIKEELGDLLYTVVFYGKVAEREGRFSIDDILESIREKLIRRHPHVFGSLVVEDADEVVHNWEKIKKEEKGHEDRKSTLDGIPSGLPALLKAQKILRKLRQSNSELLNKKEQKVSSEEEIGKAMLELILRAEDAYIDVESALRRALLKLEEQFRTAEELA